MNHSHKPAYKPTLVVGATGKTGRRTAQRLIRLGVPTRAVSRRTDPAFDWNDRTTWDNALAGMQAVYISYAPDLAVPGTPDTIRDFVEQAAGRGIRRVVLLSGRGEPEAERCERIIQRPDLEWTVVRASWFNQNFSEGEFAGMVLAGAITLPAAEIPEPFVDADDIADVATVALTEEGHAGQVYEVTGPRMLTFKEVAAEISRACGLDIQYVRIPHEAFVAGVAESGAPKEVSWLLDYLFGTVLDGRNAHVCDGIERALGRPPTDFSEYARRVADSGVWDEMSTAAREAGR